MKKFYVGIKGVIKRDDAILVLKKNSTKGFWEIGGGRINGDETIDQTLQRELQEELPGIKNIRKQQVLCTHRLPFDVDGDISLVLIYFLIKADLPDPIQISDEHTEFRWVKSSTELPLDEGTKQAALAALGK